jgi:hypothetical protein
MPASIVRNISTTPHPRNPTHAIITDTIRTTSNPTTSFLLVRVDEDRALILGSFRSMGRRLFIRFHNRPGDQQLSTFNE